MVAFTNLTPEHIEAHGGFDAYKAAKGKLFAHLTKRKHKIIRDERIEKVAVINQDDPHALYFASFSADERVYYRWGGESRAGTLVANRMDCDTTGCQIFINGNEMRFPFLAPFELMNTLSSVAIVYALGYGLQRIGSVTNKLVPIPGRFEHIRAGQPFEVIVDYAYEPYALEALFKAASLLNPKRIIGVHGSAGGGRDVARREKIGRLAGEHEDIVIVTNEDPYDEDPRLIIEQVASGARLAGKRSDQDLFLVDDRQEAIFLAISKAQAGDVVLLTGKGSEPVMAVKNRQSVPWSDREAARQSLKKIGYGR